MLESGRVCERRKLPVNVVKKEVMRYTRIDDASGIKVRKNGERFEEI